MKNFGWVVLWAQVALGAPTGVPNKKVSFEFRQIALKNLFTVLSGIAAMPVQVAPCAADRNVDLRLDEVPLPLVFDVLASRLRLTYTRVGDGLQVGCADVAATPSVLKVTRVTVDAQDTPVSEVLQGLARQVGAPRVEGTVPPNRRVTLHLERVQLETVSAVLLDTAGVFVSLEEGVLVVGSVPRPDEPWSSPMVRSGPPAPTPLAEKRPTSLPAWRPGEAEAGHPWFRYGITDGGRSTISDMKDEYLRGYQLKETNREEAIRLFRRVVEGTPVDDEYHQKALTRLRELLDRGDVRPTR